MTSDTYQKIIIALITAIIGLVITQLTAFFSPKFYRRKIIKLLHEELKDLDKEAMRLVYFHQRNLQLYGGKRICEGGMLGLANPIYTHYYKDAVLSLNQNQRISFQLIHGLIAAQNVILAEINKANTDVLRDHRTNGPNNATVTGGEILGELAKDGYSNCSIIKWHIDFHMKHKSNPDLSPNTKAHDMFLKYLDKIVIETQKTIDSGKTIPKENYDKFYFESTVEPRP